MFVPPEMKTNVFARVAIPSNRQMFQRYGVSLGAGHPDGTDPSEFKEAKNQGLTPTDILRKAQEEAKALAPSSSPENQ